MHRTLSALFALFALLTPLAACGGDDDGGGSIQAYCDFSRSLDEQEDFPTDDQLDELSDTAPDEISDDVEFLVDRFREANDNPAEVEEVFQDEEVNEAIENVEAFEEENCADEADGE
ncbi:MAG: hypothetical protein ACRDJP_01015 [Actinomycetota bacterium]